MSLETPAIVQKLQTALHAKAKGSPNFRFYALYDKVYRNDILRFAYECCKANGGAAGIDGQTFEDIDAHGTEPWLDELAQELKSRRYRPQPVRRVYIPKPDGKQRPLGIPAIKDRVAQTAAGEQVTRKSASYFFSAQRCTDTATQNAHIGVFQPSRRDRRYVRVQPILFGQTSLLLRQAAGTIVRFAPATCAAVQNVVGLKECTSIINGPSHSYVVPSFIAACKHNRGTGNRHVKFCAFQAFRV